MTDEERQEAIQSIRRYAPDSQPTEQEIQRIWECIQCERYYAQYFAPYWKRLHEIRDNLDHMSLFELQEAIDGLVETVKELPRLVIVPGIAHKGVMIRYYRQAVARLSEAAAGLSRQDRFLQETLDLWKRSGLDRPYAGARRPQLEILAENPSVQPIHVVAVNYRTAEFYAELNDIARGELRYISTPQQVRMLGDVTVVLLCPGFESQREILNELSRRRAKVQFARLSVNKRNHAPLQHLFSYLCYILHIVTCEIGADCRIGNYHIEGTVVDLEFVLGARYGEPEWYRMEDYFSSCAPLDKDALLAFDFRRIKYETVRVVVPIEHPIPGNLAETLVNQLVTKFYEHNNDRFFN